MGNDEAQKRPESEAGEFTALLRRDAVRELGAHIEPENQLQTRLAEFWAEATAFDRIGIDDDFFALGGTSIQAARLFSRIEREFNVAIRLSTLYDSPTVRALATEISAHATSALPDTQQASVKTKRLVSIKPSGSKPPLFIIAGVGGGVVGLAYFARALDQEQPVYALESRGLHGAEEPLYDIREIAAEHIEEITAVDSEGPYFLFGICWGALVVLEMAAQLQAAGKTIGMVSLLDPPPILGAPVSTTARQLELALTVPKFIASRLRLYWRTLKELAPHERRAYLRRRLAIVLEIVRKRDLFRGDSSELLRRKVDKANRIAARMYEPPKFRGPVSLLFTSARPKGQSRDGRGDWARHLGVGEKVIYVPGRDTANAMSRKFAHHVASALGPQLPNSR